MVDSEVKCLFVFDFDHTFVDGNSDTYIYQALKENDIPNHLKQSYKEGFWTEFMQKVFIFLKNEGKMPDDIRKVLENIPLTNGMAELVSWIRKEKNECIIISDANTLFIDWILEKNGLRNEFSNIFTNPARINIENVIEIQAYHSHNCLDCPINMCKRAILEEFIGKQRNYKKIFYIGDGGNDFCPIGVLKEKDWVFARKNYCLEKKILKKNKEGVLANVSVWENGFEIIKKLEEIYQK